MTHVLRAIGLVVAALLGACEPSSSTRVYCHVQRGEISSATDADTSGAVPCPAGWYCRNYPPGFHGLNYRCCRDARGANCPIDP